MKKTSGWARQLRGLLPGQTLLWVVWMLRDVAFWCKTETWSPTCEAQLEAQDEQLLLFSRSFPACPHFDTRALRKFKLTTSTTNVMTTSQSCLFYKLCVILAFLNNSRISQSLIPSKFSSNVDLPVMFILKNYNPPTFWLDVLVHACNFKYFIHK